MKSDVSTVDAVSRFRKNRETKKFTAYAINARIVGEVTGSGMFGQTRTTLNQMESRVPGVDYKGHAYISLTEENGTFFMNEDYLTDDVISATRIYSGQQNKVEVTFVYGTMADFKKGKRTLHAAAMKQWDEVMRKTLKEGLVGQSYSIGATLETLEISPNMRYEVENDEIAVINPSQRVVINYIVTRK